jgi:3-oxoadipate enol-lactonase
MSMIRVDRGGFSLSAEIWGEGAEKPWLVLSNSLGASRFMWDRQKALLTTKYRVLAYDTRGHGGSDAPPGPYSFADLTGDVLVLMDHLGIAKARYMGLSLGGMTGLGLAVHHAARFEQIVCCNARADSNPAYRQNWDDRIAAVTAGGMQAILAGSMERWFVERFRTAEPEAMKAIEAMFTATKVPGYIGCCEALKTLDYLKDLPSVRVPVTYIAGEKDMAAPAAAMRAMAEVTPGARYVEIPDAAHLPNIDNMPVFNAALGAILALT